MYDRVVKKVVVDAGHGGSDPGATGSIIEKEYNLKIANYIYDRLKELGIPVAITRSTDTTLSPTERVNRILNAFGNSKDVIVLSNHLNAGGGTGAEVVYALRNNDTLSKLILEEISKEGQSIRKWYQRRLPSDSSKDYYFIHRNTGNTEPVLIEYGFVDNQKDANFIKNNWQDLAEAVVRAVATYVGANYDQIDENSIYIVQKGDSLYSIAKKFNVGIDSLKSANNLQNNLIRVGQKLVIPGFTDNTGSSITYVVQKGDTLYKISSIYNVSIDDIKKLNNLTSNILSIGQELKIPSETKEKYIVQKGDTLYSIARKYNTTVNDIKNLNNLSNNILTIGEELYIPNK